MFLPKHVVHDWPFKRPFIINFNAHMQEIEGLVKSSGVFLMNLNSILRNKYVKRGLWVLC